MKEEKPDKREEIAGLSDEELVAKYEVANKLLFGKPYPYQISGDMAYFTMLADELRKRGFKGRGIDDTTLEPVESEPVQPEPAEALDEYIDEANKLKEQREDIAPQLVVANFCMAIIEEESSHAAKYCHPARATEVLEEFSGAEGQLYDYKPLQKIDVPDREIEGKEYPCCKVEGSACWDYEGDLEIEEWDFELVKIEEEWKIC